MYDLYRREQNKVSQSIQPYSFVGTVPVSFPTVAGEMLLVTTSRKAGWRQKIARHLSGFSLAALALLTGTTSVHAQAVCRPVHGQIEATGLAESCPAEFCSVGRFAGAIKGDYLVATTTLLPKVNQP